jgi:N-acetyl sugar amidotransferase
MKYCKRCILPDTKPGLSFDNEGICNACRNFEKRAEIDWNHREIELISILNKYRSQDGNNYDCIIPVSGGKDSTYQVITMKRLGMNPLCVTSSTCHLTNIGRNNIENIKSLGVDYIEVSPNKNVRAKLNRIGLETVGDISWPEHVGIFTIPIRIAVSFQIPLIIWGENSQNEYGGPAGSTERNILDRSWLEEFGGLLGLRVSDLDEEFKITKNDLILYNYPSDAELNRVGVTGLFLGYYAPWDGLSNALISSIYGFESYANTVEGSAVNYENLDNYQTGVHDYFKYLKFGFGRASDLLSIHIRRNRIQRSMAIEVVKRLEGKFPKSYLGKSLEDILEPLDLTVERFIEICDEFTNINIFKLNQDGSLYKDPKGNLVKRIYDNE